MPGVVIADQSLLMRIPLALQYALRVPIAASAHAAMQSAIRCANSVRMRMHMCHVSCRTVWTALGANLLIMPVVIWVVENLMRVRGGAYTQMCVHAF